MTIENICEAARMEISLSGSDAKALVDRADDLSRTVAAMGDFARGIAEGYDHEEDAHRYNNGACRVCRAEAILSRPDVTAERGRWVRLDDDIIARLDTLADERDAAIARADRLEREAVASLTAAGICLPVEEPTAQGEIPMAVHKLARERDEVGIQFAAQGERLRLAMACVKAGDFVINDSRVKVPGVYAYFEARAALDAVPGDALPPSPAGVSGQPSGSTPAASSATSSSSEVAANPSAPHGTRDVAKGWDAVNGRWVEIPPHLRALEASGIDTERVK